MPTLPEPWEIKQGATFEKLLEWRDAAKSPYDLTGCHALLQARTTADSPDVLFEMSSEDGTIDITQGLGKIRLIFEDEATANLDFDMAVFDLLVAFPDGTKRRCIDGEFVLSKGVTKWPTP